MYRLAVPSPSISRAIPLTEPPLPGRETAIPFCRYIEKYIPGLNPGRGFSYIFTNNPIGQMPLKQGVEIYQQPGPVSSQLTSRVMSCQPSGNKAVNPSPAWIPRLYRNNREYRSVSALSPQQPPPKTSHYVTLSVSTVKSTFPERSCKPAANLAVCGTLSCPYSSSN